MVVVSLQSSKQHVMLVKAVAAGAMACQIVAKRSMVVLFVWTRKIPTTHIW